MRRAGISIIGFYNDEDVGMRFEIKDARSNLIETIFVPPKSTSVHDLHMPGAINIRVKRQKLIGS